MFHSSILYKIFWDIFDKCFWILYQELNKLNFEKKPQNTGNFLLSVVNQTEGSKNVRAFGPDTYYVHDQHLIVYLLFHGTITWSLRH